VKSICCILLLIYLTASLPSCAVLRLLNSGTANIKYRASEATINGIKYEESDRVTSPSFSIRNVQHPKPYGKWGFNVRVSPSLHYDDQTYQTGKTYFNQDSGNFDVFRPVRVRRGILLGNLKFTTHTPIGAFSLSGGFGGTMYNFDDGAGLQTTKTREIRRLDLVWYGFFTKRFFILAGPRYYKAGYETFEFAFRIGYFWGRIEKGIF